MIASSNGLAAFRYLIIFEVPMTLARHLMVDFNQMKTFVEDPLVLDRGEGIRVTDTAGRSYIDGLSGVFTTSLGHANTEVI